MQGFKPLLATALLATSLAASAGTVTIDWANPPTSPPGGDNLNVSLDFGANFVNTTAGRFNGVVTSSVDVDTSMLVSGPGALWAYCYDLYDTLAGGQYEVIFGGGDSIVLDFLGAVNSVLGGSPFAWLEPGSGSVAAAIQLGIWDALYDADFDLGNGIFQATGANAATIAAFESFVAAMAGADSLSGDQVLILTADGNQDVISGLRERTVAEPGSLALLGLGLIAALAARRRPRG
jgi:hypothetical protein